MLPLESDLTPSKRRGGGGRMNLRTSYDDKNYKVNLRIKIRIFILSLSISIIDQSHLTKIS
jgi:hypothetical protein